jgi:acyl-CoA hydrolase
MTDKERQAAVYFQGSIEAFAQSVHRLLGNSAITVAATVILRRPPDEEGGEPTDRPLTCVATSFASKEAGENHVSSLQATLKELELRKTALETETKVDES